MTTKISGDRVSSPGFQNSDIPGRILVQAVRQENNTWFGTASTIPAVRTPVVSDGGALFNLTITPKKVGSLIVVDGSALLTAASAADWVSLALFQDNASADTSGLYCGGVDWGGVVRVSHEFVTTSVAPVVFQLRFGAISGNCRVNGNSGVAFYGGKAKTWINVKEYV